MADEIMKIHERLSKRGIKMSKDKLENAIVKFILEREDELIEEISQRESDDRLKKWLETPVDTGRESNAVKEHNLVI